MAAYRPLAGFQAVLDEELEDKLSMKSYLTYSEKFCHPRNFEKLQAWISENYTEKRKATPVGSVKKGTFLDLLRREANKTAYSFVPSPEFKPGRTYVLPPRQLTHNYRQERTDRCVPSYTYLKPANQLCKDRMKRRVFCEVLGEEVCFDCNGREVRGKFNNKMNALYPYLEYHEMKRPYGYCPRALRLTEPLPSRSQIQGFPIPNRHEPKQYDWLRMNSDLLPNRREGNLKVVIRPRSYTC